ncbi:rCG55452, partial [Rattus norvegicus]
MYLHTDTQINKCNTKVRKEKKK